MSESRSPTDRRIREISELEALAFDQNGLLPVVAQDAGTGEVLMVAWANRTALEQSLISGTMHYWSRSRGALWKKGETSGNTQAIVSLHADCDGDTLLARVVSAGPACHTGEPTCFGADAEPGHPPSGRNRSGTTDRGAPVDHRGTSVLEELWTVLEERARERPEGSYTTRLLADENLRIKKLGEETAELVTALARGGEGAAEEGADLIYHLMVALLGAGRQWAEIEAELAKRRS